MECIIMTPVDDRVVTTARRGKYHRTIKDFDDSGRKAVKVRDNTCKPISLYLGLRRAVGKMGLEKRIYVQQVNKEIHLVRMG